MKRTVPFVIRQEVKHEQLRLREIVLVLRNSENNVFRNNVSILLIKNTVFYDILLVHRYGEFP